MADVLDRVVNRGKHDLETLEKMGEILPDMDMKLPILDRFFCRIAPFIVEFIGTFFLVLTVGCVSTLHSPLAPFGIGSVLMVMIYMGGHISGAHYNPAVTLGVRLSGRGTIGNVDVLVYWVVQICASLIAACSYWLIADRTFYFSEGIKDFNVGRAFLAEFLFTFALVTVILNVATTNAQKNNSFFGVAIGFTVAAGVVAVGPVSGGVFNPAVGTGPLIIDAINRNSGSGVKYIWIYYVAPMFAGVLAAILFRITNPKEYQMKQRHHLGDAYVGRHKLRIDEDGNPVYHEDAQMREEVDEKSPLI